MEQSSGLVKSMAAAVLSGFVVAIFAPWIHRATGARSGWILFLPPLALFGYFLSLTGPVVQGEPLRIAYSWIPALGIQFSFYVDGLALLFALIISGIGAAVTLYAGDYLKGHPSQGLFYAYLLAFMASMLGVVLSDNMITLFVFWELTGLCSYFLIGLDHERPEARYAAWQALLVTGLGGLALLGGMILLALAGGSLELSSLLTGGGSIQSHRYYPAILLLVLLGAFTKSAQFPFHFWLPNAMEAPAPVSAYLHSATMVKAGIYLLARLSPVLGGSAQWVFWVTLAGSVTMAAGAFLALFQTDLKRLLAYSTVSALGMLTMLLGIGTPAAVEAMGVFLLAHALYKGGFFLVAGAVDHESGAREVTELGGLRNAMPRTALAGALVGLSMAGLPLLFGFVAKEAVYESLQHANRFAWAGTALAVASSMAFVVVALLCGLKPFWGEKRETPKAAHEAPRAMWIGPVVLGALGLLFGVVPQYFASPLLSAVASSVLNKPIDMHLSLWHGFGMPLGLSLVTLAGGLLLYGSMRAIRSLGAMLRGPMAWGPAWWYDLALAGIKEFAGWQTRMLQSGYLRYYLLTVVVTALGLSGYTLVSRGGFHLPEQGLRDIYFYEFGLAALMLLAALAAVRSTSRLGAIASLGVVGYGVALVYILFGAPDLAMTQFLVETLTVIIFVLVFYHLPKYRNYSSVKHRAGDAIVAVAFGSLMTLLVLVGVAVQFDPPIFDYFAEHSYLDAHGRNVVNVILVDFRGFDTMGEIAVLAVAGIGVYSLLKLRLGKEGKG